MMWRFTFEHQQCQKVTQSDQLNTSELRTTEGGAKMNLDET